LKCVYQLVGCLINFSLGLCISIKGDGDVFFIVNVQLRLRSIFSTSPSKYSRKAALAASYLIFTRFCHLQILGHPAKVKVIPFFVGGFYRVAGFYRLFTFKEVFWTLFLLSR
jgi:hypothetical protein